MSLETDLLIDRRRLKRRLFFWRMATFVAVVAGIAALAGVKAPTGNHVARLTIEGPISDTSREIKAVEAMIADTSAKALIVAIESPGGTITGSDALYQALMRAAAKKPVVAVMGGVAASGGYMVAMPARRVFARAATLTGSIGVIFQTQEFSGLAAKLGIGLETIVSGPLKGQPNAYAPLSEPGREALRGLLMDIYEQFVDVVMLGRHLDRDKVHELATGRVYTGRQALAVGLVDEIGDEAAARKWLVSSAGIAENLPIVELKTKSVTDGWLAELSSPIGKVVKAVLYQGLALDGPLVLWQPSPSE